MNIIGVDPGATGAIALLTHGELADVIDTPVIDKRVNVAEVARWFKTQHGLVGIDKVVIENVHSMPGNSGRSMFAFGRALGDVEACAIALGHVVEFVSPAVWKRDMGLSRRPGESDKALKDRSRQRATDLWPTCSDLFARVKDDGRAEAALIAKWGMS